MSRDLAGSFYAPHDWKKTWNQLATELMKLFDLRFKDNGNSFNSCFQFVAQTSDGELIIRIKIYWKTLALLQSETVQKATGMKLRGLYYPDIRMRQALRDSRETGLSRIEISYTATNRANENQLLAPFFGHEASHDLNKVQMALKNVKGLCWKLPVAKLLEDFVNGARGHQLLIV